MHHACAGLARRLAVFVVCWGFAAGGMAVHAQAVKALTDQLPVEGHYNAAAFDDAGAFVYFDSNVNLAGGEPLDRIQVMEGETATDQTAQLTTLSDGVVPGSVAVSDDGAWLALLSTSNPLGFNADRSVELFVMHPDGSQLDQLTDNPHPDDGTIYELAFAGSDNRVAFVSDTDPLATNGSHVPQIFVIDRDGTGLAQITNHTVGYRSPGSNDRQRLTISDDGERIAYAHPGDPVGSNPEGNFEIFAINHDGTNLRQLTSTTADYSMDPFLSGNGEKIVFEVTNASQVWIVSWDGTGRQQLNPTGPAMDSPSITDDAMIVAYCSFTVGYEVYKINADGTGGTRLTTNWGNMDPVISGDGSRIVFRGSEPFPGGLNEDGGEALMSMDSSGGDVQLLAELEVHRNYEPDITSDGTRVAFLADPFDPATNPDRALQVFRIEADGSDPTQVTAFVSGEAGHLGGITDDGELIVFSATADPVGCNNINTQIFTVDADGTSFNQLSPCPPSSNSDYPTISGDGSRAAFQSSEDPDGDNDDGSPELLRYNIAHSGAPHRRLDQLTSDDDHYWKVPRLDGSGTWVVFQSQGDPLGDNPDGSTEIFRIDTDGTGLEQLTDDPARSSVWPDVSASGERIVYASEADPLGTNPENNSEIFMVEPATATTTQLTFATSGDSTHPSISDDGSWVYFRSEASFFEPPLVWEPYRVEVATGVVERVGGLRAGGLGGTFKGDYSVFPDGDGDRAVFAAWSGDWSGTNPDGSSEVYLIDFNAPRSIEASKETPTVVSWTVEPQPVRYDVIRGDVASLQPGGGNTVDLGAVYCVENDSADNDTVGDEDPDEPAPGETFFYLRRGSQGVNDGPGSWGQGTGGKERVAGSGVCDP